MTIKRWECPIHNYILEVLWKTKLFLIVRKVIISVNFAIVSEARNASPFCREHTNENTQFFNIKNIYAYSDKALKCISVNRTYHSINRVPLNNVYTVHWI